MYHYNDTYMSDRKLMRLEKEIQDLKQEIMDLGDMRPGSLSIQTRKTKDRYGSYWHLSYTHQGKGRTQYIRERFVGQIKSETNAFKRFRGLVDRWIALSIKKSDLKMKLQKDGASN